ncbi:MAG TPA: gephyrin-like molybdotransferase Glp, partial [Pseudonocardiaceae bacterium]
TAGTNVLRAGQVLTPAALGLAAALGLGELKVIPRQRVLVMSTGSELVAPGTPLRPGQIYESNAVMLAAAVRDAGAEVIAAPMTGDDVATFRDALTRHVGDADLIITTGGVSAGAYEVVKDSLGGEVEFVKVAMQPGMPQGAGIVNGTPIITLPGNPVSALVSFEVFVRPAIRLLLGKRRLFRRTVTATALQGMSSPAGRRQYRRGLLHRDDEGRYSAEPVGGAGSHLLASLARANCLIVIDEEVTEVSEGDEVTVIPLLLSGA